MPIPYIHSVRRVCGCVKYKIKKKLHSYCVGCRTVLPFVESYLSQKPNKYAGL